ncbi:hypothetical protein Pcinc_014937 [Petrolisthes cinctipes]|uniref:Secreted protein n=1 Tax=Petrolisthes cinctipes TaxID=88211 RepID=A0AAE1FVE8_PETCI|nr:hypothetical protein Pcinc_014937 [Petrolisthes cinctipes]
MWVWAWVWACTVWAAVGGVPVEEEQEQQQILSRITRQQPIFGITAHSPCLHLEFTQGSSTPGDTTSGLSA